MIKIFSSKAILYFFWQPRNRCRFLDTIPSNHSFLNQAQYDKYQFKSLGDYRNKSGLLDMAFILTAV